jgi:class 3 adenylate cyclase
MRDVYQAYTRLDSVKADYKAGLKDYKRYMEYRDSEINEESAIKTKMAEMNFEYTRRTDSVKAEQDRVNAVTEKEQQRLKILKNAFIGGFSITFLAAGIFFIQRRRITKEKKRSDELRKRSDELLLNILPAETAEELKLTGEAKAKNFDWVTVMFTDFKDFTKISDTLSPTDLVAELHYLFQAFDNIIHKYNIEKIKTIGDSYMAAGGLPVANQTHAKDLVNAAIEIVAFMEKHKLQRIEENKPVFEIRIGINTGPVVAGIVGVKKFQYDIWGDTVNLASRMESSGEPGKVNISGSTYELVKNDFTCTYRGKIQAKNKGEVDMYFVSGKG